MHEEKKLFDNNLTYMLMGAKGKKNKYDAKCRKDIGICCKQPKLELIDNRNHLFKPKATYSMNYLRNNKCVSCLLFIR